MKNLFLLTLSFLLSVMVIGCRPSTIAADGSTSAAVGTTQNTSVPAVAGRPLSMRRPIIIYRTRSDYSQLVPITLDADHRHIVAYPDPVDVGAYSVPVSLSDGYLFDRRGISPNTAYTSYTYEAYHSLSHVPSVQELESHIVERYPLVEMWDCSKPYYELESAAQGDMTPERQKQLLDTIVLSGFAGCRQMLE